MLTKKLVRDQKWLLQLSQSVFFFYPIHQLSATELQRLSLAYRGQGFGGYLFGRRGHPSFGPRRHAAYGFLSRGNFYCLHGPTGSLWQQAVAGQPALANASFGLWQGHFFLQPQAPLEARLLAPAALCGSLHASGNPLVYSLSFLVVQLTQLLHR